jgi:hypothetical protein
MSSVAGGVLDAEICHGTRCAFTDTVSNSGTICKNLKLKKKKSSRKAGSIYTREALGYSELRVLQDGT